MISNALNATGEMTCDVAVIGGGLGGCAAALAAAFSGMRIIMTEETDWLGGQLTAQAVPPDEHRWIESHGCTRLYRSYRNAVREYYRRHYPLTEEASARLYLNPGDGWVSALTHEPRVSLAVLESMMAPYCSNGQLQILRRHKPVHAEVAGDRALSVTVQCLESGLTRTIQAPFFLDATEQGDLLPLTGTEHTTGCESQRQTGEPHAPEEARPASVQAFTCCFAIDCVHGSDHIIEKPHQYAFWRAYVPVMNPTWPGPLLSWTASHYITLQPRTFTFDPECDERGTDGGLWAYRRIARKRNFRDGAYPGDISLINWPQNDYWLGNLHGVQEEEAAFHLERGKQLSLSLLYWLQTEAPRPDGGEGWRGLRLRRDIVGTEDGLAKYPYIRESRRIHAEFTVLEQHISIAARTVLTGENMENLSAQTFPDSVGIGSYRIDLHPSSGGDNYVDIDSLPFQIPLGALIPERMENLLPAAKNLGVTHITNGCYRVHPVEWNIGESAGALAAYAIHTGKLPRQIRNTSKLLEDFQSRIQAQGIEIAWPDRHCEWYEISKILNWDSHNAVHLRCGLFNSLRKANHGFHRFHGLGEISPFVGNIIRLIREIRGLAFLLLLKWTTLGLVRAKKGSGTLSIASTISDRITG